MVYFSEDSVYIYMFDISCILVFFLPFEGFLVMTGTVCLNDPTVYENGEYFRWTPAGPPRLRMPQNASLSAARAAAVVVLVWCWC